MQGENGLNEKAEVYDWGGWSGRIRSTFNTGVPLDFLSHPTIAYTMVFARRGGISLAKERQKVVVEVFGLEIAKKLLLEDYIGMQIITDREFLTSANRSHHASHLAYYTQSRKRNFWDSDSIIEWGGGYGNMARIIRNMNPGITYTIIDLPELLALQYVYLTSVEGEGCINVNNVQDQIRIVPGKINLISSHHLYNRDIELKCDGFLSTWAITKSPRNAQSYVMSKKLFNANHLLLGSKIDSNNHLAEVFLYMKATRVQVPTSRYVDTNHEYWFK